MPTRGTPPLPPSSSRGLTGLKDKTCWLCGDLGLKDKTCWFCGDFSALSRGKVGVGDGGSQLEGWTKRVGFVVTFRLAGAGKSVLEVVVSLRVCAWSLDLSRWGLGRSFASVVSTVPGRWHVTGCATGAATGGAMSGSS